MTTLDHEAQQALAIHQSEVQVSVELQTPDMTLNLGPQHPSTHGVLRLVAKVDGEIIEEVEPVIGYMHRGYEKLAEVRTYPQITALVNRIDWVSGFANEIPFMVATERLMDLEVPERAQHIRLILTEMARIANHLIFLSSFPLELGAPTPLMHALRERERVLDLLEGVTGGRFHPNFNRVGGVKPAAGGGSTQKKVKQDLPQGFLDQTRDAMVHVRDVIADMRNLVLGNDIFVQRTRDVGIIPPDKALEFGVSGPNLRASGIDFDLRKMDDYLPYSRFEFDVPTGSNGDCFDRYRVRLEEVEQASLIIDQAIDTIPEGDLQAKVPRVIKVPAGQIYVRAENPKGEMGYYVVSEGGRGPYRLKIRSASFSNLSVMPWLLRGQLVPDIIAILGSLDFVLGDVDR